MQSLITLPPAIHSMIIKMDNNKDKNNDAVGKNVIPPTKINKMDVVLVLMILSSTASISMMIASSREPPSTPLRLPSYLVVIAPNICNFSLTN